LNSLGWASACTLTKMRQLTLSIDSCNKVPLWTHLEAESRCRQSAYPLSTLLFAHSATICLNWAKRLKTQAAFLT
jgi:hypothetical protein